MIESYSYLSNRALRTSRATAIAGGIPVTYAIAPALRNCPGDCESEQHRMDVHFPLGHELSAHPGAAGSPHVSQPWQRRSS
jgi:hypothetical protein